MTVAEETAIWRLDVGELGRRYAAGVLSPVEVLAEVRRRVEQLNPTLNAVVALDLSADAAARASEARWRDGAPLGPLDGVPLTVKDNLLVEGMPATWGSRLFRDHRPDADELPVARLRAQGAVIVGKTNVPELTLEGYTSNPLFGTTCNPWDPALTPGGSSGGAVAAVASGIAPIALCTDGGGSIRRPASHAGLVGVKPSIGWAARHGGFPNILLDLEVVGPIARRVRDAATMLDAIAGPDPRDRKSLFLPSDRRTADRLAEAPSARRILYVRKLGDHPLDPAVAASVDAAADTFAGLGHRVEEGTLPFDVEALNDAWPLIGEVGVAYLLQRHPKARTELAAKFVEMGDRGAAVPGSRYLEVLELIDGFRRDVAEAFRGIDVIMTPSAAALPWPADVPYPGTIDGQTVGPRGHAVYTGWVNACGHPGINLPASVAPNGLPIGFQIVGDFGADAQLLRLAAAYERTAPWSDRWPALADG